MHKEKWVCKTFRKTFFPKFSFKKGIGLVNIFCTKNIQYFHFDYKIRKIKIKDMILEFLLLGV